MNHPQGSAFLLGARGFIGRHLARRLAEDRHAVIAATRAPATFEHPGIRNVFRSWDDTAQFARWLSECAAAIHAGSSSTPGSSDARDRIEAITGRPFERIHEPSRRVNVHSIIANADAARASFGWMPIVPLDSGLQRTWQWFNNRD